MTTAAPSKSTPTWTRRNADGTILALSSDNTTIYRITLSPASCECAGFTWRQTCRHLVAAQQRYGAPEGCPVCAISPLSVCPSCAVEPVRRDEISDLYA